MSSWNLKKAAFYLLFTLFWAIGILSCEAQTLPLVNIMAVDAPALHSRNGRIGIGSLEHFGKGIIIDSAGIIATNRHIIDGARHIYVVLEGNNTFEASVLRKGQSDLCFIKITPPYPLKTISFADSSLVQIGSKVIAMANVSVNRQRMLGGRVSEIFKEMSSNKVELLEINIPLKPGDSGSPVLNEAGSLLGLVMGKKLSDPSKSYAIASNRIQQEYLKYKDSVLN